MKHVKTSAEVTPCKIRQQLRVSSSFLYKHAVQLNLILFILPFLKLKSPTTAAARCLTLYVKYILVIEKEPQQSDEPL